MVSTAASDMQHRRERRRQERRGDRQEQVILDATERLLAEHRFEDLSVAAVADAAGMSRPGVYFYFASMEDLLVAVVRRGLSKLIESLEEVPIPDGAMPVDVLELGLRRTRDGWRAHGPVLRAAIEHAYRIPGVYEQWRALLDRGIDLYVALMSWTANLDGRPAPEDADARRNARLCMLMVGHAFHDRHESDMPAHDEDELERDLLLLVSRALELTPRTQARSVT